MELKGAEELRLYLYEYPEDEQDLYLSYYLDELPDLIEEPELLWRLIVFERSIYEDEENKDYWRVAFQDYVRCFPWTEEMLNAVEKPDLSEWQEKSREMKAQKPKRKPGMRRLFVVRKDLHMSPGKLAAQIGHCAEIYWLHMIENAINDLCLTELTPDEGKDTCTTCFWTRPLPNEVAWQISRKFHLYMDDADKQDSSEQ